MKNTALGIAVIGALLGAPALAADMAVKAPPPSTSVVTADWTGLYLDAGVGWQNDRFNWTYTNFVPTQLPFSLSKSAGSIAGHIGYQQQFGWLVVGGEFGTFASMNGVASVTSNGAATTGPCANLAGLVCQASIASADLAGGKLGVDWGDWLVYGVGGDVFKSNIATQVSGIASDTGQPNGTHGWYAGGGFDYLLYKSNPFEMIVGIEYQHVKLDTVTECSVNNVGIVGGCPGAIAAVSRLVSATEDAVWGKVTVKFNPLAH